MGNCILYKNSTSPQAKFSTDVERLIVEDAGSFETGIDNSGSLKPTVAVTWLYAVTGLETELLMQSPVLT